MQQPMHPLLQDYLNSLAKELKGLKGKDSAVEEISSHLLDAIEQLREEGLEADVAVCQALERLGDPRKLGARLRAAHRPWYLRWFVVLPSSLALLSIAAIAALVVLTDLSLRASEQYIRDKDRALALFFKDQETLRKYPFLEPAGRLHDAGPFLNSRVSWDGHKTPERFKHPVCSHFSIPSSFRANSCLRS